MGTPIQRKSTILMYLLIALAAYAVEAQPPANTGSVKGRVTYANGKLPRGHIWVLLYGPSHLFGLTDEKGNYLFVDVPLGTYRIWAWIEGEFNQEQSVTLKTEGEIITLDLIARPPAELRAILLDADGTPLAKTQVEVIATCGEGSSKWTSQDRITTNEQGEFVVEASRGVAECLVIVPGKGWCRSPEVRMRFRTASQKPVLRLQPFGSLTGTVVLPEGATPAEGCEVEAWLGNYRIGKAVRTDAQGTFRIAELPAGRYRIWARLAGYALTPSSYTEVSIGNIAQVTIKLEKGSEISGQALQEEGNLPAINQVVVLSRADQGLNSLSLERLDDPIKPMLKLQTDAQGRFTFGPLAAGQYAIAVAASTLWKSVQSGVKLRGGESIKDLRLPSVRIAPGFIGLIRGPGGWLPHSGHSVAVWGDLIPGGWMNGYVGGKDGTYTSNPLPEGTYTAIAYADDLASMMRTQIVVKAKGEPPTVNFNLTPGGLVEGLVKMKDGQPFPTELSISTSPPQPTAASFHDGLSDAATLCDQNGRFTFEHLASGNYTLYIYRRGRVGPPLSTYQVTVKEGQRKKVEIVLE